MKMRKAIR
jgi:hypothetical protein